MNAKIKVEQITAEKIIFEVTSFDVYSTKWIEMPLADAAKIIDAINKYADISIAARALEEFID